MKRIVYILILTLCVAGCTKEDRQIQGVWALTDFLCYKEDGTQTLASTDIKTWTFKKDGIGYINGGTPIEYKKIGSELTITYIQSGKSKTYEIQELTGTRLKVFQSTPRFYIKPGDYLDGHDDVYIFKRIE